MRSTARGTLPLAVAGVAMLLLLTTGASRGNIERFEPPLASPGFDLPVLDGGRMSLQDFGGKPLFLSLWATWCTPCKFELAEFQRARGVLTEAGVKASFMTVNINESGARVKTWLQRNGINLPVLLASQRFLDEHSIVVLPSILVFDADSRLAATHRGWAMETDLVADFQEDLAALAQKDAD